MAAGNTVVSFTLRCIDKATKTITSVGGAIGKLAKGIWGLGANLGGWVTSIQSAASTVQGIFSRLWGSIQESFKFESLTIQFKTLLGSMEAARERMSSLATFAEVTPFNLEEVVKASRTLTVFSDGALGTEYSLRLVGDAAAAVGAGFDEVAFWVGRAYAMIKGGQPFGEAAMRLQELGILTPAVRTEMEALQASGAKNSEVWEAFAARLEEFGGAMEDLSQTGDGLTSTLEDTWTAAVREFGDAFQDAAKESIGFLITLLGKLKADGTIKEWAQAAVEALTPLKDLITAILGNGEERSSALKASWDYLKAVFGYGGEVIKASGVELMRMIMRGFASIQNFAGKWTGATWLTSKITGASQEDIEKDTRAMWEGVVGGSFSGDLAAANAELAAASSAFSTATAEAAQATRERVSKEAEAAEAAAQASTITLSTAKAEEKRDKDATERAKIAEDLNKAQEEAAQKRLAKEGELAESEDELAKAQERLTETTKKLEEMRKREADFHARALDSREDKRRREEEKEKKRQEDREKKLRRDADRLLKRFATLSDPNALLRADFDVSKLGHRGRALREWLLASQGVATLESDEDEKKKALETINGTLENIRKELHQLLRQS